MNSDELDFASVGELRRLLDDGSVSSRELTERSLDRLDRVGRALNAVATLMPDRALAEADRADRAIRAGASKPLLGIPYGAKDLLSARGAPTMWGSAAYVDQRIDEDAQAVARLRRAGAVLVAKLATMELAGFHGTTPGASVHGPGLNPWAPERWSAGSSSGSGAAVGGGLVPFALGTETGGSIGSPSAFCGVTGLRPTLGLVSRYGVMPLAWSLDKVGPMAHTAADCATVLEAISGFDGRDHDSVRRGFRVRDVERARSGRSEPWRLAVATADLEAGADPQIRPALEGARHVFRALGVELVEAALPPEIPYDDLILAVVNAEGTAAHGLFIDSGAFDAVTDPEQRSRIRDAQGTSARTYVEAMRARHVVRAAFAQIFRSADAILTYSVYSDAWPASEAFRKREPRGGFSSMVAASNLAELPALFLPVDLSDNGLPVGVQLVGPRFSEATLLAIGEAFQDATAFHRRRPPPLVLGTTA